METANLLTEMMFIDCATVPSDITGAAVTGDYYSMRNYSKIVFLIQQGAWAGGTPAVTLVQTTDVTNSLSDAKALTLLEYQSKVALTGTTWTTTAVTSNTFNLTATANTLTVIEVDAASLDADNNFDCVRLAIGTPGTNTDLLCVMVLGYGCSYPQTDPPNAKINAN